MYNQFVIGGALRDKFSDEEFFLLCRQNSDLRIERNNKGEIIIKPPVNSETGNLEGIVEGELYIWNKKARSGRVFSSSAAFTLPDNSVYSPDASWVSNASWKAAPAGSRKKFARIVPEFVAELRSPSDSIRFLHTKMENWIRNGVRLAWLIDPDAETVWIYRAAGQPQELAGFHNQLSGEDVLPGFVFDLEELIIAKK